MRIWRWAWALIWQQAWQPRAKAVKLARVVALLLCAALIVLAVALPNTDLAWLRADYRWLGQPLNWIEGLWPTVSVVHILLFALLGITAGLALPGWSLGRLLLMQVAFVTATELLQFWAPGRTPRLSDVAVDMLGAALGLMVVRVVRLRPL